MLDSKIEGRPKEYPLHVLHSKSSITQDANQNSNFPLDLTFRSSEFVPTREELYTEVCLLEKALTVVDSPVVFCHNDLLLKNIVFHEQPIKGVTFIDFEYGDFNYQAFDIGNHFCEFAGVDNYDPSLYPEKSFQLVWLKHYLGRRHELLGIDSDMRTLEDEAELLYQQVRKFTLAAHLFWGIWALIQAEHSTIKFDFMSYAIERLNEYFARKTHKLNGHL